MLDERLALDRSHTVMITLCASLGAVIGVFCTALLWYFIFPSCLRSSSFVAAEETAIPVEETFSICTCWGKCNKRQSQNASEA